MPRAEALGCVGGYFPDLKGLFFDPWRAINSRWSLSQQGMQVHSASVPMSNSVIWNPSPQLSQVLASRRVVFSFLLIVPFLPVVVAVLSMPIYYPLAPLTVKQKQVKRGFILTPQDGLETAHPRLFSDDAVLDPWQL